MKLKLEDNYNFSTKAVHAGQNPDPHTGAVIPAISLSTTFAQSSPGQYAEFDYSRAGNPNRRDFEKAVAYLENAEFGIAFSSGLATASCIMNMFPTKTHVLSMNDVYGGTFRYFNRVASNQGYCVDYADLSDSSNVGKYLKEETKLVWIESPTNPTLKLVDIKTVATYLKQVRPDVILVVDNTFCSPFFQQPLELGADIVVHSVTKYINGHSDVLMGIAVTRSKDIAEKLKFIQLAVGSVPSPFDCFLANRGLKTLHLRMLKHQSNALKIAEFLESSPYVENVIFPGLISHPQHELAKKQQTGYSGMISFRIKGNVETAKKFLRSCKVFTLAESLGGIESLCELPCIMTHASVPKEERANLGITENLIRLSVGIESEKDLINDLRNALELSAK
jgi:cystathionine gamma-lyase